MHATHENNVGPSEIRRCGALDILIDETDRPFFRQIGGDDEQALGRHEGPYAWHECKCMGEGAERRRVGRKDAKDVEIVLDRNDAAQANPLTPALTRLAKMSAECLPRQRLAGRKRPPTRYGAANATCAD